MKTSITLVNALKTLSLPQAQVREARAMFVAQALAFLPSLVEDGKTVKEILEANEAKLNRCLNEINEFLPVDIRLTQHLYKQLIKQRLQLLNGVTDTGLLCSLFNTPEATDRLSLDMRVVLSKVCSDVEFYSAQASIADALKESW